MKELCLNPFAFGARTAMPGASARLNGGFKRAKRPGVDEKLRRTWIFPHTEKFGHLEKLGLYSIWRKNVGNRSHSCG